MHVPMLAILVVVRALVMRLAVIVGRCRVVLGPAGFFGIDSRRQRQSQ